MSTPIPLLIRLFAASAAMMVLISSNTARADEPPVPLLNEWWQWALSIPSSVNPILDNSGKACALGQRGNVWFLAGNTGGRSSRQCTLPAGVRVLIPLHNSLCFPDATITATQCQDALAQDYASFTSWSVVLNGLPQAIIEQPPVPGEYVFSVAVPRNALFGYKPGLYRVTNAAGRWALIDLAVPGVYTLRVQSKRAEFALDVAYELTVADLN
jgi:hypothetical protein